MINKVFLLLCFLIVVDCHVKKEIPEHLKKKYGLIDPTKQRQPKPDFDHTQHKPKPKDPTRSKSHDEIPRVPDKDIHEEEIPHDEHNHIDHHVNDAMRDHEIAKVKMELQGKKPGEPLVQPQGESMGEDHVLGKMIEDHSRNKTSGFNFDFMMNMVFKVYFREKHMKRGSEDLEG